MAELFISIIAEIELFSKPDLPPEEEASLQAFIADSVSVVDINPAIKKRTIELRRSTNIKLPDCIIAATSIVLNAVLLTNDEKLLKLTCPGYRARNLCAESGAAGLRRSFRFSVFVGTLAACCACGYFCIFIQKYPDLRAALAVCKV